MKVRFIKQLGNKEAGTVCEMNSFLFSDLKRAGYVVLHLPGAYETAEPIVTKAPTKPIIIKKKK